LFKVELAPPKISFAYTIKTYKGEMSKASFKYTNKTDVEHTYELSASHPDLVSISENFIKLAPGETKSIPILLKMMNEIKKSQVLIFVNEIETNNCDVLIFSIYYAY